MRFTIFSRIRLAGIISFLFMVHKCMGIIKQYVAIIRGRALYEERRYVKPSFFYKGNIHRSQSLQLLICFPRNVRVKPISTNRAQCRGPVREKYGIYVKPSFFTWAIFTATKAFFFYYADKRLFLPDRCAAIHHGRDFKILSKNNVLPKYCFLYTNSLVNATFGSWKKSY